MKPKTRPLRIEAEWGPGPWEATRILQLRRNAQSIVSNIDSGNVHEIGGFPRNIEMLEELAWIAATSGLGSAEVIESSAGAVSTELRDMGPLLPSEVLGLKQTLFAAQKLPTIRTGVNGLDDICQFCFWAFERLGQGLAVRGLEEDIYMWPNLPSLQASASGGCCWCRSVREALFVEISTIETDKKIPGGKVAIWVKPRWKLYSDDEGDGRAWNTLDYVAVHCLPLEGGTEHVHYYHVESRNENARAELGIHPPPHRTPLAEQNIELIHTQLDNAMYLQKKLNKSPTFIPLRLIDLGSDVNSPPKLRVLQQDDYASMSGPSNLYAALSYCWGPAPDAARQLKLTTENMGILCHAISSDAMTPVMRDAVSLCRALGIRWLWIDAVCIVQDSKSDWEQQAAQMAHIYSHSWVTICAASSASCMEGFLGERRDRCVEVEYVSPRHGRLGLNLRFEPGGLEAVSCDHLARDLIDEGCLWNYRGWTFQEKNLSPRKLVFGSSMVHLILHPGITTSEGERWFRIYNTDSYGNDNKHRRIYPWTLLTTDQLNEAGNPPPTTRSGEDFAREQVAWEQLIEQYTAMKWTFREDVFPALSGIATHFHDLLDSQDQYLAGLWKSFLHCNLLWSPASPNTLPTRSPEQLVQEWQEGLPMVAPSWSWASRDHPIKFAIAGGPDRPKCSRRYHMKPEFVLLDAHIVVDGVNPFGRLKSASLRMKGRVLPLRPECVATTSYNIRHRLGDRHVPLWKYRPRAGQMLYISTDWSWENAGTAASCVGGVGKEEVAKLRLLLLSSCCSFTAREEPASETLDEYDVEENPYMNEEGFYNHYAGTMYIAGTDTRFCPACSQASWRRDVWGLLLYPADDENGSFYRVGLFFSYGDSGGSSIFKDAEEEMMVLI